MSAEDPLEREIRRRIAELERTLPSGTPSAGEIRTLSQLGEVMALRDRIAPKVPPSRAPVAFAFFGSVVVASVLLFAETPTTVIELDVAATGLVLLVPAHEPTLSGLAARAVTASGLRGLDGDIVGTSEGIAVTASSSAARVLVDAGVFERDGRLEIRQVSPQRYELWITGASLSIHIDGAVRVVTTDGVEPPRDEPARYELLPGPDGISLELDGPATSWGPAVRDIAVLDVRFSDGVREISGAQRTSVRPLSSIVSGRLFLEALGDRTIDLRPGEHLDWDALSEARLRSLVFAEDGMRVRLRARVRGLRHGFGEMQSAQPVLLEYVRASEPVALLWGAALYLYGLVEALRRWLRVA